MDIWVVAILQWLHVFFGIFWFGSTLTIDFLVVPTLQSLPPPVQQAFGGALGKRAPRVITPIAVTTIVLGLIRGIAGGVIGRLDSLYGLTWVAAFFLGTGLLVFSLRVLGPAVERLQQTAPGAEFDAALARTKRLTVSELGGFLIVLVLMIAMRFGY